MLRLLVAAALLGAGQPRLVYEPEADFYGADEITVEVTTDADADNASTVIPIVVAPIDDAATLLVSGTATAEAGSGSNLRARRRNYHDVDGGDALVELVINADRGSITLKPTAHDAHGVRLVKDAPLTLDDAIETNGTITNLRRGPRPASHAGGPGSSNGVGRRRASLVSGYRGRASGTTLSC